MKKTTAELALAYLSKARTMSQYASLDDLLKTDQAERAALITALDADLAQVVEPFAWCVNSKSGADWCFSATEAGVTLNAKLMDGGCVKTEPFPVYTTPQAAPAPLWVSVGVRLPVVYADVMIRLTDGAQRVGRLNVAGCWQLASYQATRHQYMSSDVVAWLDATPAPEAVNAGLLAALELFMERVDKPPRPNCSCHLSPPCNDCVEHGGLREAFEFANDAIAKAEGAV